MEVKRVRRRGRRRQEEEPKKEAYPHQRVLYDINKLKGRIFYTRAEQKEALASNKWIEHPRMSLEDWLVEREKLFDKIKEEQENLAETVKFRDSNLPPRKRYISQMNVKDLVKEGLKLGIDYTDEENRPTKAIMQRVIMKAQAEQEENK